MQSWYVLEAFLCYQFPIYMEFYQCAILPYARWLSKIPQFCFLHVCCIVQEHSLSPMSQRMIKVHFLVFIILDSECSILWKRTPLSCYKYINKRMTFYEARRYCRRHGADLATSDLWVVDGPYK